LGRAFCNQWESRDPSHTSTAPSPNWSAHGPANYLQGSSRALGYYLPGYYLPPLNVSPWDVVAFLCSVQLSALFFCGIPRFSFAPEAIFFSPYFASFWMLSSPPVLFNQSRDNGP